LSYIQITNHQSTCLSVHATTSLHAPTFDTFKRRLKTHLFKYPYHAAHLVTASAFHLVPLVIDL